MGYNKPNPLKMMESALKMYKAEKKGGMHRMESPMYAKEASRELKDMPIVDIEKGDAKGSPANNMDHKEMSAKDLHQHRMVHHTAKPPKGSPAKAAKPDYIDIDKDGNTTEPMKEAAKAKGSPATRQGYNDRLDESLAKDGKESSKKQSMKDRRDESKGMKKSKGKGAYSSDPKMS
jgi:hypothetical protein